LNDSAVQMDAAWRAGRRKRFAASGGAESATRNRL
jgi:hypothetical protein